MVHHPPRNAVIGREGLALPKRRNRIFRHVRTAPVMFDDDRDALRSDSGTRGVAQDGDDLVHRSGHDQSFAGIEHVSQTLITLWIYRNSRQTDLPTTATDISSAGWFKMNGAKRGGHPPLRDLFQFQLLANAIAEYCCHSLESVCHLRQHRSNCERLKWAV